MWFTPLRFNRLYFFFFSLHRSLKRTRLSIQLMNNVQRTRQIISIWPEISWTIGSVFLPGCRKGRWDGNSFHDFYVQYLRYWEWPVSMVIISAINSGSRASRVRIKFDFSRCEQIFPRSDPADSQILKLLSHGILEFSEHLFPRF